MFRKIVERLRFLDECLNSVVDEQDLLFKSSSKRDEAERQLSDKKNSCGSLKPPAGGFNLLSKKNTRK